MFEVILDWRWIGRVYRHWKEVDLWKVPAGRVYTIEQDGFEIKWIVGPVRATKRGSFTLSGTP